MALARDSIRVLHVDDDADFAAVASEFLEREADSIVVETARSAGAGLERLDDDIDCVVSDYEMPGRDGIEFLEAVRGDGDELPFILFTGKGSEEIASRAISAGVTDYLQKRHTADQYTLLANRIENAVERARSQVSYREVFEKADIGLTVRDIGTGELLDANQRYCDLLGYSHGAAMELDLSDITADVDGYTPARAHEHIREAVETGTATFEWPDERKDGTVVWVEISMERARIEGRDRLLVTVRELDEPPT